MGNRQRAWGRIVPLGLGLSLTSGIGHLAPAWAETGLFVAYPPVDHQTVADQIFFIGTADPDVAVTINGQPVSYRSEAGHFAPSFPLTLGDNLFTIVAGDATITRTVTRLDNTPPEPQGLTFAEGSIQPSVPIARRPDELICFSAIAPPQAEVAVQFTPPSLAATPATPATILLRPSTTTTILPPNYAVLTQTNAPQIQSVSVQYEGCATGRSLLAALGYGDDAWQTRTSSLTLGTAEFTLTQGSQTLTQPGAPVEILSPEHLAVATVTVPQGTARTGPSTSYSRLTPLPQGTQAQIIGQTGDWWQLDYGAWIRNTDVTVRAASVPPRSQIRSVTSRQIPGWTEVIFPLQVPVPVSVDQGDRQLTLTLHNTTAQTDTMYFGPDPIVEQMNWQPSLTAAPQYTFQFRTPQQWGYRLHYEGSSLILGLRHPPAVDLDSDQPLAGMRILVDPGHGSDVDLGARGPTGYPEKDVTLPVSLMLRDELEARGATVLMSRTGDDDVHPNDRTALIETLQPTLSLSVHYNALPDNGDALNTAGVSVFWYNPQAHSLAAFLQEYLVTELDRPSDGVYWNNLALTRPAIAPAVLLELGFMINPDEFEWIMDPAAQVDLVQTLADGVEAWTRQAIGADPD